jgi:hypothetical protein
LSRIRQLASPVLIVHSRDDEVVPYRQGRAIYDAAPAPKAFLDLRYGHNEGFILSGDTYTGGLETFLAEHVGPRPPRPKEPPPTTVEEARPRKERRAGRDAVPDAEAPHDAEAAPDPELSPGAAPPSTESPPATGALPKTDVPPATGAPPDDGIDDLPDAEPPILD